MASAAGDAQVAAGPVNLADLRLQIALDVLRLCRDQIVDVMGHLDLSRHYSVDVDMVLYLDWNQCTCNLILQRPYEYLPVMDEALQLAQRKILEESSLADHLSQKRHVHARCVSQELDTEEVSRCDGKKFKEVVTDTGDMPDACRDYQEIKVQEQVTKLAIGNIPRAITVILENDLVDTCKPGDDVSIIGTVIRRWRNFTPGDRGDVEIVMLANHVKVNNEHRVSSLVTDEIMHEFMEFWEEHKQNPMQARNIILESFCPTIVGVFLVKLAVMLVLVGGVARSESGMKIRGDSHILLVGDPGIGKSQFLRYAARISPRSILTTGIGSTNAGLTVAAVKDSGEWQLEAGALVLADRGLCCIDEFGSIREQDKTAIHEAMEQQAGIVCKLNTRCSILAATNPKGKYDPGQTLEVNVALASPLLSRFDLVLTLMDTQNDSWDRTGSNGPLKSIQRKVSSFILGLSEASGDLPDDDAVPKAVWSLDKLRSYVSFVKAHCIPRMTDKASTIIQKYYQLQRLSDGRNVARTTVRLLESLIRLAQSHVCAVTLMEVSMQASGFTNVQSALHRGVPSDAELDYLEQESTVLSKLGLGHLATASLRNDNDSDDGSSSGGVEETPLKRRRRNFSAAQDESYATDVDRLVSPSPVSEVPTRRAPPKGSPDSFVPSPPRSRTSTEPAPPSGPRTGWGGFPGMGASIGWNNAWTRPAGTPAPSPPPFAAAAAAEPGAAAEAGNSIETTVADLQATGGGVHPSGLGRKGFRGLAATAGLGAARNAAASAQLPSSPPAATPLPLPSRPTPTPPGSVSKRARMLSSGHGGDGSQDGGERYTPTAPSPSGGSARLARFAFRGLGGPRSESPESGTAAGGADDVFPPLMTPAPPAPPIIRQASAGGTGGAEEDADDPLADPDALDKLWRLGEDGGE
ncbi:DNA helicase mcm9 [Cladochytrium tenue]|nr:DNA helicase mcm9 [Cladochytrium tenue]